MSTLTRLARRFGRIAPWWRRFKRNGYRVDRCAHCGHRFRWSGDGRHANGNRDGKVFHQWCMSYLMWRAKGDARLDVLRVVVEITGVTYRDVSGVLELRAGEDIPAFSVFHDLEESTQ